MAMKEMLQFGERNMKETLRNVLPLLVMLEGLSQSELCTGAVQNRIALPSTAWWSGRSVGLGFRGLGSCAGLPVGDLELEQGSSFQTRPFLIFKTEVTTKAFWRQML